MSDEIRRVLAVLREKERRLCRKADAQPSTQYAQRLAAEAEGIAWAADQLEPLLPACARVVMQSADDSAAYLSVPCTCGQCPA